ncbi:MAG: AI-2E family transporter [Planctomycetes bacterium]|nr:AI-2E family transporter [Planctomycetota bacterium]
MKKIGIWAGFLFLLYELRDFFGLIFLTFVLSYITSTIVNRIQGRFSSRLLPVVLVYAAIVGSFVGLGWATIPGALRDGREQVNKLKRIDDPKRFLDVRVGTALGQRPIVAGQAAVQGGMFGATFSSAKRRGEDEGLIHQLSGYVSDPAHQSAVSETISHSLLEVQEAYLIPGLKGIVSGLWKGILTVFLALLFSFMIVWDMQRLGRGVNLLQNSRMAEVWEEVAPSIATFARLLGKAFEAQTVIALINTALTATGMLILGIPGAGFLAVVVFLCSFVPIVGVFVSTVPIALVALQQSGVGLLLAVLIMVVIVHMIEAYVLNPRIYGAHLKLHPLAVLVVLYLGEHLFGIWGLILGVPLATYVWRHLIKGEANHLHLPEPGGESASFYVLPPAPAVPSFARR